MKEKKEKPVDIISDIYENAPNPYTCEGCPDWDDINGCWAGVVKYFDCDELGEDSRYWTNHIYGEKIEPYDYLDDSWYYWQEEVRGRKRGE